MIRHHDDIKQQIERILNWGPSEYWQLRDFRVLSDLVRARTGRRVNDRDLQTFWRSSATVSSATLTGLARFADYDDWDDFCGRNAYGTVDTDDETQLTHMPGWEIPMNWVIAICWLSVLASILIGILLVWKR